MQNEIEALSSVHLINCIHEAIFVIIINTGQTITGLLQPARIIANDIATSMIMQLRYVLSPNFIDSILSTLNLFNKNFLQYFIPTWHSFIHKKARKNRA